MLPSSLLESYKNAPFAVCLQKIEYDNNGKGCDAVFLEVNPEFEKVTGFTSKDLFGKRQTEVFQQEEFKVLSFFEELGKVAVNGARFEKEVFFSPRKKWIRKISFSPKPGYIICILNDITKQKEAIHKLVNISEVFLQLKDKPIDYQQITDLMQEISGAKFVILNLYDENGKCLTTKSVSGPVSSILRATSMIGFNLIDKEWNHNPSHEARIEKNNLTVFNNLIDLAKNSLPRFLLEGLEDIFNVGEIIVAKIRRGDRMIGDFNLIFEKGTSISNKDKVEMFSRQVGIVIMQHKAEQALRENETKYREIFESIHDIYFETDLEGKILEVSPSIESLTNGQYKREELLGTNLREVYYDFSKRETMITQLQEQGQINDYPVIMKNLDGTKINCSISARLAQNKAGKLEKITGIMRDTTQRTEAENALKASEERFRKLSEASSAAVLITQENSFRYVNKAAEKISGFSEQELLKMTLIDLAHPDHKEFLKKRISLRKKGSDIPKRIEIKIHTKSGEEKWLDITSENIVLDNQPAVVATAFDITDRKLATEALRESEERFRSLIDNAFEGIYLIQDGKYQYVNDRFCEITGCDRKLLLEDGFDYQTLLTRKSIEYLKKRYKYRKEGKRVPKSYELEIISKDRSFRQVEVSNAKIIQRNKPFYIGTVRDITERKANEKLREKIILAEKTARFKQNFLANMSHEMRTPMNGIIGMTRIMAKSKMTNTQRDYLKVIEESSKSLLSLINDVLHLSKIEAGKVELNKNTIYTSELIEKVKMLYRQPAKSKNLEFYCISDKGFPDYFIADESKLMQIINNLASNAIKFTNEGFVKVFLRMLDSQQNSLTLQISVEDSGVGIKPEHHQLIFEEFSQVDNSRTRLQEGTGLGLTISKKLIEMMGGTIMVKSKPGEGTSFIFSFIAQKVNKKINPSRENYQKDAPIGDLDLSVLIVEDKLVNRLVAELMLKDLGCRHDIAENGLIAIEKVVKNKYDVVLMDIQMPVMDGITAVKELRKLKINLPSIIGLSAEALEGDAERYIAQGMDDYLTKPIDQNLLAQKLFLIKQKMN